MALPKDINDREHQSFKSWGDGKPGKRTFTIIYAEDVDNPGTYRAVQGQYSADGYFQLITSGSGTSTTNDALLLETGDTVLLETGDKVLLN